MIQLPLKKRMIPICLLLLLLPDVGLAVMNHGSSDTRDLGFEGSSCLPPDISNKFAVDTDGGDANGSGTHQSQISYGKDYGFNPDPNKFMGAVAIDPKLKLKAFDVVCYENTANGKQTCGFVFDNGYTSEQMKSGVKPDKPAEATALVHKQLGATHATGAGTSLGSTTIKSYPRRTPEAAIPEIKAALKIAQETGNYHQVNQLAQELGGYSSCSGSTLAPQYDTTITAN